MGSGASAEQMGQVTADVPQDLSLLEQMVAFTKDMDDAEEGGASWAKQLVTKLEEMRNKLITQIQKQGNNVGVESMITLLCEQISTAKALPDGCANEVKYTATSEGHKATLGDTDVEDGFTLGKNHPAGESRLVVTPLTRQCRQKMFEAFSQKKMVYFHGPAGSGKMETMKDTMKDLGVPVTVFNCCPEIDWLCLQKFLAENKPCIFIEFDRLSPEVLAKFASMVPWNTAGVPWNFIGMTGSKAINDGDLKIPADVQEMCLSQEMAAPPFAAIAEVMLFHGGFLTGDVLGPKLTTFLEECKNGLSKQSHYDFGMRKLLHIKKRASYKLTAQVQADCKPDENLVLATVCLNVVWDMAPKDDRKKVKEVVDKIFGSKTGEDAVRWTQAAAGVGRVVSVRHGGMLVNMAKEDEDTAVAVVAELAKAAGAKLFRMPGTFEAMTKGEIFGSFSGEEWKDGAFSQTMRDGQNSGRQDAWIVVVCGEGGATAEKFEDLNTVLDDNKVLCLISGERIRLLESSKVIFIAKDCSQLSPAHTSRMGMVWA